MKFILFNKLATSLLTAVISTVSQAASELVKANLTQLADNKKQIRAAWVVLGDQGRATARLI